MNEELMLYLAIGAIVGAILGVIIASILSPRARRYNQVKRELDATKQELISQKQMIVKHFSHSAELLDNMAKEFRTLYQHMAENSNALLADIDPNSPEYSPLKIIKEKTPTVTASIAEEPPKDYSGSPSGLLKTESKNKN
ncbi:DUF1043 family protein [Utexia brackfieldae]|uniref:YhcB family protein n=1 Tax=Utexia brackfieldae TaxID=3074108 RepID=UPI00370DBB62